MEDMFTAQIIPLMGHGFGSDHGSFASWGPWALLPLLLIPLLLGLLLFWFFRRGGVGPVRYNRSRASAAPSPEDVARTRLAERLANGDISPEEYLERTSALRNPTATPES